MVTSTSAPATRTWTTSRRPAAEAGDTVFFLSADAGG
jgi:hypothetical protein